ncbi:Alpha-amylase A [Coccomyxa sp. Obi]|nr:Alpha-amylase A [Coccomyxa sp. Obi]
MLRRVLLLSVALAGFAEAVNPSPLLRFQHHQQNEPLCSSSLDKVDCGLFSPPGRASCEARNCCWDESSRPPCFFSNARPVPDPLTSVQVHLFEWSWNDVAKECEFLGQAGFTGVQVSPPHEDIVVADYPDKDIRQEPWWTRYQPVSYKLVSRSGGEEQFVEMVRSCRAHGIDVYVDVVINHMAGGQLQDPPRRGRASTPWHYRQSYGDMYSAEDFHRRPGMGDEQHGNCQIQDQDFFRCYDCVQQCDLGGLADLDTSKTSVQKHITKYLNRLAALGVAGIRIDASKHINHWDLGMILQDVNSSLYIYHEVLEGCGELVLPTEYTGLGQVIEFRWAQLIWERFLQHDLQFLGSEYMPCGHLASSCALVFVENHDRQSNCHVPDPEVPCISLTYQDGELYKTAVAFTLAYPYGSPQVLSSYYYGRHGDGAPRKPVHGGDGALNCGDGITWVCQHRWPQVANMVQWRKVAGHEAISHWYLSDDHKQVQFSRGNAAMMFINVGDTEFHGRLYNTQLPAGVYCNVLKSGCEKVEILGDGSTAAGVTVGRDSALALHLNATQASMGFSSL